MKTGAKHSHQMNWNWPSGKNLKFEAVKKFDGALILKQAK